jgi:hypothetical protein
MVCAGTAQLCLPIPTNWSVSPENLCCEAAPSTMIRARLVPPGAVPSKVGASGGIWGTRGSVGHLGNRLSAIVFCRP